MARSCTVCHHPELLRVNNLLASGMAFRAISRQFALSKDALRRHHNDHISAIQSNIASSNLVLSLFPGADLFGRSFESFGCCVVRGPDLLFGHDIVDWPLPPGGRFDGVIGGPPCQPHSTLSSISGSVNSRHEDQIARFWQIVASVKPRWAVMENVLATISHTSIPYDAKAVVLRDWDCGGNTHRKRVFFVWPGCLVDQFSPVPLVRPGRPSLSVLASSWKTGREKRSLLSGLSPVEAGRLQGFPDVAEKMLLEGDSSRLFSGRLIVHVLGNGVPRSMGIWIAQNVLNASK